MLIFYIHKKEIKGENPNTEQKQINAAIYQIDNHTEKKKN